MLGIPVREYRCMPFGEFCDLVSCYQVAHGMAKQWQELSDEEMIPDLL